MTIPETEKPTPVVLTELDKHIPLELLPQHEPLRRHAPSVRLERERKDVRVVEQNVLLRHGTAVERAKDVALRREANDRDVLLALGLVENSVVSKLVNRAVEDDRCPRQPRPLLEGVDAFRHRLFQVPFPTTVSLVLRLS